jgi:hypothetical protein
VPQPGATRQSDPNYRARRDTRASSVEVFGPPALTSAHGDLPQRPRPAQAPTDPSAPYAAGNRRALPHARIVLDRFHPVMLANQALTDVRQRVALRWDRVIRDRRSARAQQLRRLGSGTSTTFASPEPVRATQHLLRRRRDLLHRVMGMGERSDAECLEILRGLGYSEEQIDAHGGRLAGGLNAWVDAEIAQTEEQVLGADPAAYAAEMAKPWTPPIQESLSVEFIDYQGLVSSPVVVDLAKQVADEFRRTLDDYGSVTSPVTLEERLEDNADGTPRRHVGVTTSGDESTLDLLHDNVIGVMAPRLRDQLNSLGAGEIRVNVWFASLSDWF